MAKYVCDFEQVTAIGEKICQAATDISSSVKTYSTSIDGDLSEWNGNAKDQFNTANTSLVSTATTDAEYVNSLGEFIKKASSSIQELEEELASLSI